jgi:type III pantothenate kinase
MLIVFDIGNTNITIGLFDIEQSSPNKVWRLSANKERTADEYVVFLTSIFEQSSVNIKDIKHCAIASVVPALNLIFEELTHKLFSKKPFFINHKNTGGLKLKVQNPEEVGADRIANAAAAWTLFGGGVIVIDIGTATTFDCIDLKGRYIGGAIALGPNLASKSLNIRTAQLPYVNMEKPKKAIGSSTIECIQSGLYYGYIGLIKELIIQTKKETKIKRILATGGLAQAIADDLKEIDIFCPNLTLQGIKIVWKKSV